MSSITGIGIGLRGPHVPDLLATERRVDFLEIIPENYLGRGGHDARTLERCAERWPLLVHGVSLSLGGPDPFDPDYLEALRILLRRHDVPFYSDHLCFSTLHGFQTHELVPLPHHDEAVAHVAARIRVLRQRLEVPIAVENISAYATMPGSDRSANAFVRDVCSAADCGLLLDVNNLYVNARNFGQDPLTELDTLPLDRVVQLHVAGHEIRHGRFIDNHGAPISDPVLALTAEVVRRVGREVPVLLERDLNLPPLVELLDEADRLRITVHGSAREAA